MSSGDIVADRRFNYARDLQLSGDLVAAEDLLVQATELAPRFAAAWFALGEIREQLGDRTGAIAAFRTAELADPGDRSGAGLRLMRLGAADIAGMRPTYVTALFDQYAPRFETALVDHLGYRGPALLLAAVMNARSDAGRPAAFGRAIDLGCGTGLVARAFAPVVADIIGIDLSPKMIARAQATGLYAELVVAEIVEGLKRRPDASAELILAADVMIYVHDVAPLLAEVARVLTQGGMFAFTVESNAGDGVMLGHGLRYSHGESFVRAVIAAAGLTLDRLESASARNESGAQGGRPGGGCREAVTVVLSAPWNMRGNKGGIAPQCTCLMNEMPEQ
jgi:predicted TPR repeat methyltransferase